MAAAGLSTELPSRSASQHLVSFQGANLVTAEAASVLEHVVGDVVRVGPHTQLRIIVKIPVEGIGVTIIGSRRIRPGRNCHTLRIRCGGHGKLSQYPPISQLIVLHNRIAVVVGFAATAKALPNHVAIFRETGDQVKAGNVVTHVSRQGVDRITQVNPLHIMVRPYVTSRIRRSDAKTRIDRSTVSRPFGLAKTGRKSYAPL